MAATGRSREHGRLHRAGEQSSAGVGRGAGAGRDAGAGGEAAACGRDWGARWWLASLAVWDWTPLCVPDYAGLRPAEARHLRGDDLTLPTSDWGSATLSGSTPDV